MVPDKTTSLNTGKQFEAMDLEPVSESMDTPSKDESGKEPCTFSSKLVS